MKRLALLLLLLLAPAAAAQDPRAGPRPVELTSAAEEARAKGERLLTDAQRVFAEKKWDDAIAAYERVLEALGDDPALAGLRDQALYNIACAHARAGRAAKAAGVFAESVAHGLRPIVVQNPATGEIVEVPGLRLEHLLVDPDLDTIRGEPAYVAALKPFVTLGEPVIEFTHPETSSLVPAFILLAADGEDAERALPAWRIAAKERRVALVAVAGPVRPTPAERRWIVGDGDERWAVAKLRETLDLVAKDVHIDPKRVFLVGAGARPGEAAWAAAMAEPARLAGFAAPGARFHAAFHADAVAKAPKSWKVALGEGDEEAAGMLKESGIEAARVAPSKDEAEVAAGILEALLGKP